MSKLDTLEKMVYMALKTNPRARDDDRELTLHIWIHNYDVNPWSPVNRVMRDHNLPSQESLGRIRRKLQQVDESLRGSKRKEQIRMDAQVDYIEYALSD